MSIGKAKSDNQKDAVKIFINERDLIEIVKDVELPFAMGEGHPSNAGDYEGLLPEYVFLPSRHFLDSPNPSLQSVTGKLDLFEHSGCGVNGCWPLVATIQLMADTVTRKDFEQPHRRKAYPKQPSWNYDRLGPFIFKRSKYEEELQPGERKFKRVFDMSTY